MFSSKIALRRLEIIFGSGIPRTSLTISSFKLLLQNDITFSEIDNASRMLPWAASAMRESEMSSNLIFS